MLSITASFVAIAAASGALAQVTGTYPATPLVSKMFPTPSDLPYKVDTDTQLIRGPQLGYNQCNSTTENQQSLCQTFYINAPDDWCITAPSVPGHPVAEQEGEMVAWCSKKGHGTRLIPQGAIRGMEWRQTPDYVQVVGFIDQTQINLPADDFGGEMDSGGADGRGNPLGGVFYSSAFSGSPVQTSHWTCFMGGGMFGCKACDNTKPNADKNCEHIYDRIGLFHNMPNNAKNGSFVACKADDATFPGVYTSNGAVMTYTQPDESLGPITTIPYTPTVPPVSQCTTFTSDKLFTSLPTPTNAPSSSKPTGSAASSGSKTSGGSGSAGPSATASSGAGKLSAVSAASTLLGAVFTALFLL